MDFSIPTLFVVPAGNVIPAAGSTDALTGTTFGIYNEKYQPVTAANAANAAYFYFAQNRKVQIPGLGTKRSEKIYKRNILTWQKIPSSNTVRNQETQVSSLSNVGCETTVVFTLRLFSNYIETAYANGLTKSYNIVTPCCGCANPPCINAEIITDQIIAAITKDPVVSRFIVASKTGVGDDAILVLTGKTLDKYGNPCLPTAFPHEYDKLRFDTFLTSPPATTQDYLSFDRCNPLAEIAVTTSSNYATGSGDEIYQLEKRYHSYQSSHKSIFSDPAFNGGFERESVPGLFYTTYYLKFLDPEDQSFELSEKMSQSVTIAIPAGQEAGFEAIVTPLLGTPETKNVIV
jgi:hypothetical protein